MQYLVCVKYVPETLNYSESCHFIFNLKHNTRTKFIRGFAEKRCIILLLQSESTFVFTSFQAICNSSGRYHQEKRFHLSPNQTLPQILSIYNLEEVHSRCV
jgi:hypothetical protein